MQINVCVANDIDEHRAYQEAVNKQHAKVKVVYDMMLEFIKFYEADQAKDELLQSLELKELDSATVYKARGKIHELLEALDVTLTPSKDGKLRVPTLDKSDMKKLNSFWREYSIFVNTTA